MITSVSENPSLMVIFNIPPLSVATIILYEIVYLQSMQLGGLKLQLGIIVHS